MCHIKPLWGLYVTCEAPKLKMSRILGDPVSKSFHPLLTGFTTQERPEMLRNERETTSTNIIVVNIPKAMISEQPELAVHLLGPGDDHPGVAPDVQVF